MMRFRLPFLLLIGLPCFGSGWEIGYYNFTFWTGQSQYQMESAWATDALAKYDFREYNTASNNYLAGPLVKRFDTPQDLRGKFITFTVSVQETGNPEYVYRTAGGSGTILPHCRLWFTTNSQPFNITVSNTDTLSYWWSAYGWVTLDALAFYGSTTVNVNLGDPTELFTAAHGQASTVYVSAFTNALANVRQIGLFNGGGSFFDTGGAIMPGTGTSTFVLEKFWIPPSPTNRIRTR